MNWLPPTSRFLMRTLHQVQRRSGNSVRSMLETDDMRHIVPELHDLVNRLMAACPLSKLKYSLRRSFATGEFMV
ncbi:MAG: hypothetical protein OJF50_003632 [Nitrospira sp.]|nr:hypothetical protein [Nitrospira sp.]